MDGACADDSEMNAALQSRREVIFLKYVVKAQAAFRRALVNKAQAREATEQVLVGTQAQVCSDPAPRAAAVPPRL